MALRIVRSAGISVIATAALAACTAPSASTPDVASGSDQVYEFSECPVIESRNWRAWISAMPGPGAQKTLYIEGEIDLPTPGFSVQLVPGPADRMMPPGQRFSLVATGPDGMAAQVLDTVSVTYAGKASYDRYRSISIGCAGKVLAVIEDIPIAR